MWRKRGEDFRAQATAREWVHPSLPCSDHVPYTHWRPICVPKPYVCGREISASTMSYLIAAKIVRYAKIVCPAQPHCETIDRITRSPRAAAMNNALVETIAPHANVNKHRCWCSSNRLFLLLLILSAVFEICACGFTFNLFVSLYFVLAGPVISHD